MKRIWLYVFLALLPALGLAKSNIVKIEIQGEGLSAPIEITDEHLVSRFSIWNGPGTRSWDGEGNLNPPAHLDPEKAGEERRFIDWPKGMAGPDEATQLPSFEVTFYVGKRERQRDYPFTYSFNQLDRQGFIYLPQGSTSLIVHGVEGRWFYASKRWDELIWPMVESALD